MALNPWLITWEVVNRNSFNPVPSNLIAAVLKKQTSEANVHRYMYFAYYNLGGFLADQIRFAQRNYGYKVSRTGPGQFCLGGSPFLFARHVWNYEINSDPNTGAETATWEDRSLIIENGYSTGFWRVQKKTYDKAANEINSGDAFTMEIPPRKRRTRKSR